MSPILNHIRKLCAGSTTTPGFHRGRTTVHKMFESCGADSVSHFMFEVAMVLSTQEVYKMKIYEMLGTIMTSVTGSSMNTTEFKEGFEYCAFNSCEVQPLN